ncbi:MAG: DegT/DnrJ/EryC1/StrS aminotransferase family protein [Deltaproteobacteria bacterium]|nr:DegT/DnrJ/EryC1/StrS aminotransferase family protein [Deltaproteobacteria bacterium]
MKVPFFRPDLPEEEIQEVVDTLRSGWLTTGPKVKRFEQEFASAVGARHAIGLNSCTAALHLGVHSLGLGPGQAVLVPTMTMAATAEVIRYEGAVPILVDCDPHTLNLDLEDAERKVRALHRGELPESLGSDLQLVGIVPVHVGGQMLDLEALEGFARRHSLWIVEDAAHAFPAAWRSTASSPWRRCGENTAAVTCFSFYANKTITTGEGGMAVTDDDELAARIRLLSLHGLSADAWGRFSGTGSWDYRIVAPGYKYNLSDIAGALGIHQLARAEALKEKRAERASEYLAALAEVEELELPVILENRLHSWHLFLI